MQTPTKYALGILAVLLATNAMNLSAATPPHSESTNANWNVGLGTTLPADACIDSTFAGISGGCLTVFPEEVGHDMVFVTHCWGLPLGAYDSSTSSSCGLSVTFYDALGVAIPAKSYTVPASGYPGDSTCGGAANGGVKDDLVVRVPAGAVKFAEQTTLGTLEIATWGFEPCYYK